MLAKKTTKNQITLPKKVHPLRRGGILRCEHGWGVNQASSTVEKRLGGSRFETGAWN
jgi:hypothetical protein